MRLAKILDFSKISVETKTAGEKIEYALKNPEKGWWIYAAIGLAFFAGVLVLICVVRKIRRKFKSKSHTNSNSNSCKSKNYKWMPVSSDDANTEYRNGNNNEEDDDSDDEEIHVAKKKAFVDEYEEREESETELNSGNDPERETVLYDSDTLAIRNKNFQNLDSFDSVNDKSQKDIIEPDTLDIRNKKFQKVVAEINEVTEKK